MAGFVVTKKPGESPVILPIEGKEVRYEILKEAVEGFIECMHVGMGPGGSTIDMWINEEGKLNGMKPNLMIPGDVVCGPILVCLGTPGGYSRPIPTEARATNLAMQMMKFHIADPDSVEVPEPRITITVEDWDD